ncbi:hypothetical protein FB45DRAFT_1032832 [Roridomyces roridus]|uniref:Uncharacterized protein n=1 Tax=Roridomyces roridus TaxID=1738132 RepID=A0AAD7BGS8_9AGAR|nr:hypothetical protein FB45DRAFT_1032832 [Roridomyces roridus]
MPTMFDRLPARHLYDIGATRRSDDPLVPGTAILLKSAEVREQVAHHMTLDCLECGHPVGTFGWGCYEWHTADPSKLRPSYRECSGCFVWSLSNPGRNSTGTKPECTCPRWALVGPERPTDCALHNVPHIVQCDIGVTVIQRKLDYGNTFWILDQRLDAAYDAFIKLDSADPQYDAARDAYYAIHAEVGRFHNTPHHLYTLPKEFLKAARAPKIDMKKRLFFSPKEKPIDYPEDEYYHDTGFQY